MKSPEKITAALQRVAEVDADGDTLAAAAQTALAMYGPAIAERVLAEPPDNLDTRLLWAAAMALAHRSDDAEVYALTRRDENGKWVGVTPDELLSA